MSDPAPSLPPAEDPKWRFHAVDEAGRIRSGVLRAPTEDAGRELLREEHLYPKRLEAADASEKVTWAPRRRALAAAQAQSQGAPRAVRCTYQSTALFGLEKPATGTLGLAENGDLVFAVPGAPPIHLPREGIEEVRLGGFLVRSLHVAEIGGKGWEFTAGFLIAERAARSIVREFRPKG